MATRITEGSMTSDQTRHTATRALDGWWAVSWLPGRALSQNQAVTAMTIAEVAAVTDFTETQPGLWPHVEQWAAELGMSGAHAVAEASLCPEEHGTGPESLRFSDEILAGQVAVLDGAVVGQAERIGTLEDAVVVGRILERLDAIEARLSKLPDE